MKFTAMAVTIGIALAAGFGAGPAQAQDAMTYIHQRQALMKRQGKDLTAIKAYLGGRLDQAHAQAAAADLLTTLPKIPSLFPQKTSLAEYPGKTRAKPDIWTEWNEFNAAMQNADAKAKVLDAAMKSGNKAAIQTAFADLGKNGCNGCHKTFRAPKK